MEIDWGKMGAELPTIGEEREMALALQDARLAFLGSCSNAWVLQHMQDLLSAPAPRTHQWNRLWRIGGDRNEGLDALVTEAPVLLGAIGKGVSGARSVIKPLLSRRPHADDIPRNARALEVTAAGNIRTLQPKVQFLRGLVNRFGTQARQTLLLPNGKMVTGSRPGDMGLLDAGETQGSLPRVARGMQDKLDTFQGTTDDLAKNYYRLVAHIAKRYRHKGVPYPDLVQEGMGGLMTALEKFEPSTGTRVSTYATWWIRQAMQIAVHRDRLVPVGAQEEQRTMYKTIRDLNMAGIADPSAEEIAEAAGLDTWLVRDIRRTGTAVSLDAVLDEADKGSMMQFLSAPTDDAQREASASGEVLATLMEGARLRPREEEVIRLRNGLGGVDALSLEQIGKIMRVSKERVRQIQSRAMEKLRAAGNRSQAKPD